MYQKLHKNFKDPCGLQCVVSYVESVVLGQMWTVSSKAKSFHSGPSFLNATLFCHRYGLEIGLILFEFLIEKDVSKNPKTKAALVRSCISRV